MDDFLTENMDPHGGVLGDLESCFLDTECDPELRIYRTEWFHEIADTMDDANEADMLFGRRPEVRHYGQFSTSVTFKKLVSDYCQKYRS